MSNKRTSTILIVVAIAAVLLIVATVAVFLILRPKPTADTEWSRIQDAGKIVVGVAADYPPFAYYTDQFQVDGYDIALMRDIGQQLGLQVEFVDFAFDGLLGALQLGQIDVAIAAISVTPDRQAVVDFSDIYYAGTDAILAHQDSTISIGYVADMASQRVGVQNASVYETWLKTNLVDTGQMPASNLFSYAQIEDAIRDLKEQRIDLVALDYAPAESFAGQGGVKIVGQGLNQQWFAIALPKGAATLQTEMNGALAQLQSTGRLSQLAQQYLNLQSGEIIPLPTPAPAPTSEPGQKPVACIDGMEWVEDLTYDDYDMTAPPEVAAGQSFVKGWRVRNNGTCTWDNTYSFVYVRGNVPAARMSGEPVSIAGSVASGATYDIQVNLIAPQIPGIYQGFWQMRNGQGIAFGETIYVAITVPSAPIATPAPTQTPSPDINFSADRTNVKAGERVVFTWSVENVKAVYFYAQGEAWQDHGVTGQGSQTVYPQTTTIYELRVLKPDDSVEIRQIRIEVEAVAGAPTIALFTVIPETQVQVGQCVDITWQVQGNVSQVTILYNEQHLWDNAPLNGNLQSCPPEAGNISYTIEAQGPGGTSRAQRNMTVTAP